MGLSEEECDLIVDGYHEDYRDVGDVELTKHRRWSVHYTKVVVNIESGRFFRISWQLPATECQECPLNSHAVEVSPHQVVKTVYLEKRNE